MKPTLLTKTILAGLLISSMAPAVGRAAGEAPADQTEKNRAPGKPMEGEVKSQAENEIGQQRKKIVDEAVVALSETKNALRALERNDSKEALSALERAAGKLNIVLARDPALALAPIDVSVAIHDVYTTLDQIRMAKVRAVEFLETGELQKARLLIRDLASEVVISVVNLPLQTYPKAIAAAAPLIDQGKIEEAKTALQTALNTLVVTDHVIPLPVMRADLKLSKAEALAKKEGRSKEENQRLASLLNEAREDVKLTEALGYGSKKDFKPLYAEIDQIEQKTKGGEPGGGVFSQIREHLSSFKRSIFG